MRIRKVEEKALFVTRAVSLTVVVLVLVTLCVFAQPVLAAQISVEPECQIVSPGEYFTVSITVYPEESEVYAASYTLYFNNTLLNATSQVNGSFLSQDGASTLEVQNVIDNTTGKTKYGETRISPATTGVTGNGTLATITFEAIADGSCELRLSDPDGVILSNYEPAPIPTNVTNGSVRVGICGDVDGIDGVNYLDWMRLGYYTTGAPGWTIESIWAANVDCVDGVDYLDWMRLGYYTTGAPGWELNCCCG